MSYTEEEFPCWEEEVSVHFLVWELNVCVSQARDSSSLDQGEVKVPEDTG